MANRASDWIANALDLQGRIDDQPDRTDAIVAKDAAERGITVDNVTTNLKSLAKAKRIVATLDLSLTDVQCTSRTVGVISRMIKGGHAAFEPYIRGGLSGEIAQEKVRRIANSIKIGREPDPRDTTARVNRSHFATDWIQEALSLEAELPGDLGRKEAFAALAAERGLKMPMVERYVIAIAKARSLADICGLQLAQVRASIESVIQAGACHAHDAERTLPLLRRILRKDVSSTAVARIYWCVTNDQPLDIDLSDAPDEPRIPPTDEPQESGEPWLAFATRAADRMASSPIINKRERDRLIARDLGITPSRLKMLGKARDSAKSLAFLAEIPIDDVKISEASVNATRLCLLRDKDRTMPILARLLRGEMSETDIGKIYVDTCLTQIDGPKPEVDPSDDQGTDGRPQKMEATPMKSTFHRDAGPEPETNEELLLNLARQADISLVEFARAALDRFSDKDLWLQKDLTVANGAQLLAEIGARLGARPVDLARLALERFQKQGTPE